MATAAIDLPVQFFEGRDGARLAYREMGQGRPVVLIHGFFSSGVINWAKYGHAQKLVEAGFRVIMPDLRSHGDSAKSHDDAAYTLDVLTDDGFALIEHLGLTDYDLGGYSLGGRTTLRMLVRGATPRRAVVAGMGLEGVLDTAGRGEFFRRVLTNLGSFKSGSAEWMAEQFLKSTGGDALALLKILDTAVDTPHADLANIQVPVLTLSGAEDRDNGSAEDLAGALPQAHYVQVPGNHMSAVTKPEMGAAMRDFFAAE
ncbi:MAG TPA: alpha/beta fold hydrolase [Burkholderiales bacterium]|jgi:pimeloyl-ACP methyl ester carboxylesterase